jgi:hypothetical protein
MIFGSATPTALAGAAATAPSAAGAAGVAAAPLATLLARGASFNFLPAPSPTAAGAPTLPGLVRGASFSAFGGGLVPPIDVAAAGAFMGMGGGGMLLPGGPPSGRIGASPATSPAEDEAPEF